MFTTDRPPSIQSNFTAHSSSSYGSVVNLNNPATHTASAPISVPGLPNQMLPKTPGKSYPVTGSPGKEALTAIGQSAQNALTPILPAPTSSKPTNHPSIYSGNSADTLVISDPILAPDRSDTTRASTLSENSTRFLVDPHRESSGGRAVTTTFFGSLFPCSISLPLTSAFFIVRRQLRRKKWFN